MTTDTSIHDDRWARLVERANAGTYSGFTPDEKIWFCVGSLLDAIKSGGLIAYYRGDGADHLSDCVAGLRSLGTGAIVTLMSTVGKLFPFGVPADSASRNAIIDSWPKDGSYDQLLDPIEEQVLREIPFIEKRLAAFVAESITEPGDCRG